MASRKLLIDPDSLNVDPQTQCFSFNWAVRAVQMVIQALNKKNGTTQGIVRC